MCLVLEHEDIIFRLAVYFNPYLNGTCIDLFRFIKIVKFSFFLELLACKSSNVHETNGLFGDSVSVNFFSVGEIALISSLDLCREFIITFELDICKVSKECCMTAVVRPVCIKNPDLCNCRNSSLLFEEILNELDVSKAHCKAHSLSQSFKLIIGHFKEAFNICNFCRNIIFIDKSGRLFSRSFSGFNGVDKVTLDLLLLFF